MRWSMGRDFTEPPVLDERAGGVGVAMGPKWLAFGVADRAALSPEIRSQVHAAAAGGPPTERDAWFVGSF